MSRIFQGDDLLQWEAFGTSGDFGFGDDNSRIIFHCLSDPDQRARAHRVEGGEAGAGKRVEEASLAELTALLRHSTPLD